MLVDAALGGKLHPLLLLTLVAKPNLQNIGFRKGILKDQQILAISFLLLTLVAKPNLTKKSGLEKVNFVKISISVCFVLTLTTFFFKSSFSAMAAIFSPLGRG